MSTRYCILASGSRGNAIFLEANKTRILIDVGLSARQIEQRLLQREIDPATIDAIVLTHAHKDHVRGVGVFAHRYRLPVFGHPDTLDSITYLLKPNQVIHPQVEPFDINTIRFFPFPLSHDCDPTQGYLIETSNRSIAICTDLGVVTPTVLEHLNRANIMVLESNHDSDMLMRGPYPWELKDRISGRFGHLSNDNCGELLYEVFHSRLDHVVLGHLSDENNTPDLALETVLRYVGKQHRNKFTVMEQRIVSEVFTV